MVRLTWNFACSLNSSISNIGQNIKLIPFSNPESSGHILAKRTTPIVDRSAKYTRKIGGMTPRPLFIIHMQSADNKWAKNIKVKKIRGGVYFDVVKKWWRHRGSMTSPMRTKCRQEMSIHNRCTLAKKHPEIQTLSKVIKSFRGCSPKHEGWVLKAFLSCTLIDQICLLSNKINKQK